jgi:hypothetical protein
MNPDEPLGVRGEWRGSALDTPVILSLSKDLLHFMGGGGGEKSHKVLHTAAARGS